MKQIERVAPTDSTVLIIGESGTGKDLIVRAIHQHSDREDSPLVRFNCGSIPHALFERLGEDHTRQVDVRIIAATNRDLKNEVIEKCFRQDLYCRLSVFSVQVSPLRERKEDIGPLADHLMYVICTRLGRPELKIKQKHILEL